MDIQEVINDEELLEVGRLAVEDFLVSLRDSRISIVGRKNGLVIAEKDGSPSPLIRIGMESALKIALEAIQATKK